jgi:hypothetical protein
MKVQLQRAPDLVGFAAANDLVGAVDPDREGFVRNFCPCTSACGKTGLMRRLP